MKLIANYETYPYLRWTGKREQQNVIEIPFEYDKEIEKAKEQDQKFYVLLVIENGREG